MDWSVHIVKQFHASALTNEELEVLKQETDFPIYITRMSKIMTFHVGCHVTTVDSWFAYKRSGEETKVESNEAFAAEVMRRTNRVLTILYTRFGKPVSHMTNSYVYYVGPNVEPF